LNLEILTQKFFILGKLLTYPTKDLSIEIKKVISQSKNKGEFDLVEKILSYLDKTNIEHLESEYTSLFVTGYPKTPCPPYFSAYQTGLVVSDFTEELYKIYENYGIELSNEQLPDFIPIMMEFMTLLLSNNLEEEAKNFYDKYLSWVSVFAENIKKNTKEEYFINIANQLKSFIKDVDSFFA